VSPVPVPAEALDINDASSYVPRLSIDVIEVAEVGGVADPCFARALSLRLRFGFVAWPSFLARDRA
jgi:hypothetical protein